MFASYKFNKKQNPSREELNPYKKEYKYLIHKLKCATKESSKCLLMYGKASKLLKQNCINMYFPEVKCAKYYYFPISQHKEGFSKHLDNIQPHYILFLKMV